MGGDERKPEADVQRNAGGAAGVKRPLNECDDDPEDGDEETTAKKRPRLQVDYNDDEVRG